MLTTTTRSSSSSSNGNNEILKRAVQLWCPCESPVPSLTCSKVSNIEESARLEEPSSQTKNLPSLYIVSQTAKLVIRIPLPLELDKYKSRKPHLEMNKILRSLTGLNSSSCGLQLDRSFLSFSAEISAFDAHPLGLVPQPESKFCPAKKKKLPQWHQKKSGNAWPK